MATPTYDPSKVITTWAGILFQGEMDGEAISIEFDEDAVTLQKGMKGFTTYTVNASSSAIATVMLNQLSPTNAALSAAAAAKLKGPFLMKDVGDLTVVEANDAMLQKFTPIKRGKEIVGYEWKLILPKCIAVVGAL
jgi:hypothetical protein